MTGMLNHLWQSCAFAAAIALITWLMRRNAPRARYWLWLAASVKFLVPFSWFVSTGARISAAAPTLPALGALPVETVASYFAPIPVAMNPVPGRAPFDWALWLGLVWLAGAAFLVARRMGQWLTLRRLARGAKPMTGYAPVLVLESDPSVEPGVFGFFRPVILLPQGLAAKLQPAQMEAILRHELRHIRYRDNLTAAVHMAVETAFWFCPPVWWIGARLVEERERDCDRAALTQGADPAEYTRGILQVCEHFVESPLACAAGISGADLQKRVREILTGRGALPVSLRGKLSLAIAAAVAALIPFGIGIARGQSVPVPTLHFEAASVKPSAPNARGSFISDDSPATFRVENMPVAPMIAYAYQLRDFQVIGAPSWAKDVSFDINAVTGIEPGDTSGSADKTRLMLQSLLAERFALQMHRETRNLPIYSLVVASGGVKLVRSKCVPSEARTATTDHMAVCGSSGITRSAGSPSPELIESGVRMEQLVRTLSNLTGRKVVDNTGYTGTFDARFAFTPPVPEYLAKGGIAPAAGDTSAPSLFTALQEQLGLKLESTRGPVEVLVIDKVERPTAN